MKKYRDVSLNFRPNPLNGDVSTVSNEAAISQALKNLILMNAWDIPYDPNVGASIRELLFEQNTAAARDTAKTRIRSVIRNYEPRAEIINISVKPNLHDVIIDVVYRASTTTDEISFQFFLKRVI